MALNLTGVDRVGWEGLGITYVGSKYLALHSSCAALLSTSDSLHLEEASISWGWPGEGRGP